MSNSPNEGNKKVHEPSNQGTLAAATTAGFAAVSTMFENAAELGRKEKFWSMLRYVLLSALQLALVVAIFLGGFWLYHDWVHGDFRSEVRDGLEELSKRIDRIAPPPTLQSTDTLSASSDHSELSN